jgi:hypothetical protein
MLKMQITLATAQVALRGVPDHTSCKPLHCSLRSARLWDAQSSVQLVAYSTAFELDAAVACARSDRLARSHVPRPDAGTRLLE